MKTDYAHNSVKMLRYIPVAAFLLMFIHVILLIHGIELPMSEISIIICGHMLIYLFSKAFGFCLLHRMLIYYAFSVMVCIWMRRFPNGENGWFYNYINEARWTMFIIGCILLSLMLMKLIRKK